MSVIKLSKKDITTNKSLVNLDDEDKRIKINRNQISIDSAMVNGWETTNKSSIDIINSYNTKIQNNEYLTDEDITAYRTAVADYVSSSNTLRNLGKAFGQSYTDEEEKTWTDNITNLQSSPDNLYNYFSQFKSEDDFKGFINYNNAHTSYLEAAKGNPNIGMSGYDQYFKDREDAIRNKVISDKDITKDGKVEWWENILYYLSGGNGGGVADTTLPTNLTNQAINDIRAYGLQLDTSTWTEEQKGLFGYVYESDKSKAMAIGDYINKTNHDTAIQEIFNSASFGDTALAILGSLTGGVDYLHDLIIGNATGELKTNGAVTPYEYSQAIIGGNAQKLNDKYGTLSEDIPIIGGKGWGDAYQLGTSIAQSALSATVGGGWGSLIMLGGSAAASGVDDVLARGGSDEQAILFGALTGLAEGVAEKIGIDNLGKLLFKGGSSTAFKDMFKGILSQAFSEGLEEGATSIFNGFADNLIMGDKSNFKILVNEYISKGMSESEAIKKAWGQYAEDVAFDIIGGALSGGAHVIGGHAITAPFNKIANNINAKSVYGESSPELVAEGLAMPKDSEAYKLAEKYSSITSSGKTLSGSQINRLVKAIESVKSTSEQDTQSSESSDVNNELLQLANEVSGVTESNTMLPLSNDEVMRRSSVAMSEFNDANSTVRPRFTTARFGTQATEGVAVENPSTVTETKPTSRVNVSEDGKTTIIKDGERVEVSVKEIASIKDGKVSVKLNNGEVADAQDVEFSSEEEGLIYEAVADMNMNAATANAFIKGFKEGKNSPDLRISGLSLNEYINGFSEAYKYGTYGYSYNRMSKEGFSASLSEEQRHRAYELGRIDREASVKAEQANIDKKVEEAKKSTTKKKKVAPIKYDGETHISEIDTKGLTEMQRDSIAPLKPVLESLGINAYFFESPVVNGKRVGKQGYYNPKDKSIHIDLFAGANGEQTILFTAAHELTHLVKDLSPAKFKTFADFLFEQYGKKGISVERLIQNQIDKAKRNGREISWDTAYEEVIADSCEAMLTDSNAIEKIAKLKAKDKTLWETIKDFILDLVAKIKKVYASLNPNSVEANYVREMVDVAEQLQSLWTDALIDAGETYSAIGETLSNNGIMVDSNTESASLFSVRDLLDNKQQQKVAKALAERFDVTIEEAKNWISAETSLASIILNPKYSQYLDYTADPNEEAIKKNSDYPQGTVDFSNICKKRRDFTEVMNRVLRKFPNHVFEATDLAKIRTIMMEEGMEVACGICYVEDRRQLDSIVAQNFIDSLALYRKGSKTRPDGSPFNTNQLKALKLIDGDTYTPSIYELISLEGRNSLKAKNPAMEEAWVKFNNARGMQSVRLLLNDAEYKRQILKYSPSVVKRKNDLGGLRIYSFSDMEMFHLIDIIQVITDSAAVGLSIQGYTKVNEYAKAVKDTGEKLNRSLIPKGDLGYHMENGKVVLDYDNVEGIDINHPDFFDSTDNPNVGNILIGINSTQIGAAMLDKFVDYIIPFHTGQSNEVLGEKGIAEWNNYEDSQSERDLATGKKSSHQINIYTEVIQAAEKEGKPIKNKVDFVNKFLEVCKENGLKPRFAEFLNINENGDYVYTEGYHKFLVDFKMFDSNTGEYLPQKPVKPIFDSNYLTSLLKDYVKSQQVKDAKLANTIPTVLERITNEIVKSDIKFSDRDSEGNTLSKEQQEFFKDSKVRDEQGNLLLCNHATADDTFTIFDQKKIGKTSKDNFSQGGALGRGFYFSSMKYSYYVWNDWVTNQTGKPAKSIEVYLNITNPFYYDYSLDTKLKGFLLESVTDEYQKKALERRKTNIELIDFCKDWDIDIQSTLKTMGYDGIIEGEYQIVAFDSNQAKLTTNKNPSKNEDIRYSDRVTDKETLNFLENQEHVTVYRAMQLIDGKLYPPMNAYTYNESGKKVLMPHSEIGAWEQSVERPDLIDKKTGKFKLDKGKVDSGKRGTTVPAAYNPYIHTSLSMLNDQFTSAYTRSNLVVVKGVVPKSELTSGYKAQYAKDSVGETEWHSGVVSTQLPESRKVILSRWFKPVEIMDNDVVAKNIKKMLGNTGIEIPYNVVSPSLRRSLEKIGVPIGEGRGIRNLPSKNEVKYSDRGYAPTFYSQMGKVVEGMKQDKFAANSVVNMLRGRGVKAEEIRWSGIVTFLENKKSVTKQELLEFIADSQLQIGEQMSDKETIRGDGYLRTFGSNYHLYKKDNYYVLYDINNEVVDEFHYDNEELGFVSNVDGEDYGDYNDLIDALKIMYGDESSARWSQYKLDGGTNYREIVFTMPNSTYSNRAMRGHWGQDAEGVLVHARIQDFDINGKTMLFVEELQSDWHNEGHEKGYTNKEYEDAVATHDDLYNKYKKLDLAFHKYVRSGDFRTDPEDVRKKKHDWLRGKVEAAQKKYLDAEKIVNSLKEKGAGDVPDAPFKNTYHEYVMKRLLRMAAEEGYDSIGWTPADIQSKRWSYDYEKAYRIEYDQDIPKFMSKYGRQWGATVGKTNIANDSKATDKISEKIAELETDKSNLEAALNDGIWGAERDLVKNMLAELQNDLDKARIELAKAKNGQGGTEVWSMDLTDSMKDSVLNEGQVLYSDRYSYETLTSKPDMKLTTLDGNIPNNRADIIALAKKNASAIGKTSKGGSVSVYVDDIGRDVILGTDGLKHGLRKIKGLHNDPNYIVTLKAGEIIKNSIQINELTPAKENAKGSYVLIGAAKNANDELYIVRFIVNEFNNELTAIDVLYAINAKKEELAATKSPRYTENPLSVTNSTISIADLLDYVNQYFPDVLPESVLRHFGYTARPEGTIGESALYQDRDSDSMSNRSLLANALETATKNDIEKNKLAQYKEKIDLINSEEAKLSEVKAEANKLRFTKGRTQAETKKMRELEFEAKQIANRINTYDRQLLTLEASKPLKAVLEREKQLAYKKAEQRGKEALAAQRDRQAQLTRDLLDRATISRKKAMINRNKTEMRYKIKKVVGDLNHLLLHGSKERNVKLGLQEAVTSALEAINMDTVSAESRIAKLQEELMKAKTPERVEEIQHSIDYIRNQGDNMADKLEKLRKAYSEIKKSGDKDLPSQFKEEASLIHDRIESVIEKVGNTPLRDMSLEQLQAVYDMYKMVLTTIRNANSIFRGGKLVDLQQNASAVMEELDKIPELKDEEAGFKSTIREFSWNEMTPYYAFRRVGSETFSKYFDDIVEGQNTYAKDISEAKDFADATRKKYGYKKWNLDKVYEFECKDGRIFKTTLKHMLSIYAYSKREQALDHMEKGGFFHNDKATFRKKGGIFELRRKDSVGYKIDEEVLADIKDAMTSEQLNYVDEMQAYLTNMGEKGNEVTRLMWGIDIFKEKVYFPLKSKDDFIKRSTETAQAVSLKNDGMTKETVPHASNPIVLEAFDDVWASHIDRMSQYHAFVIPIDNLNKIHQYGTWNGTDSMSVSTMLTGRFGSEVNEYISQFIKDLNGSVVNQGARNPLAGFFMKFKKTAVGASLSTVIQQPTAILRALAVVDAKYFVGKPDVKSLSKKWAELKKYAPIAIIKDIGGFDAGVGKRTTSWINADALRGVDKVMNAIDDFSMKGAEVADQLGWTAIWEAVKREVKANNPTMDVNSEAFLEACGKRFTEVIVQTQVYDSTLSRSGFMRSKNEVVKLATAFMGEPTLSINMLYNAVIEAKRGGKGAKAKSVRTIASVYASIIAASAMASVIYALRDDDEDESYLEKYMQAIGGEFISDIVLAPISSLPFVKDFVSIFQGWDVERSDTAIFKDLKDAFDGLDSANKSTYRKIEDFAGAMAGFFGVPLKNLLRTGREAYNAFRAIFDNISGGDLGGSFIEGITGKEKSKTDKLYDAIISGDKAQIERVKDSFKDKDKTDKEVKDAIESAMRKGLRENDSRIREAAQAVIDGNHAERIRITREIKAEGKFSQDIIVGAINAELTALRKELAK